MVLVIPDPLVVPEDKLYVILKPSLDSDAVSLIQPLIKASNVESAYSCKSLSELINNGFWKVLSDPSICCKKKEVIVDGLSSA